MPLDRSQFTSFQNSKTTTTKYLRSISAEEKKDFNETQMHFSTFASVDQTSIKIDLDLKFQFNCTQLKNGAEQIFFFQSNYCKLLLVFFNEFDNRTVNTNIDSQQSTKTVRKISNNHTLYILRLISGKI